MPRHGQLGTGPFEDSAGQSLAEFALVIPIFLLIVLAIIQFGILMLDRNAVSFAVRQAVRTASIHGAEADANTQICLAIRNAVQTSRADPNNVATVTIYRGNNPGLASNGSDNLTAHDVGTCTDGTWTYRYVAGYPVVGYPYYSRSAINPPDPIGVAITYNFRFILPVFGGGLTLSDASIGRIEPQYALGSTTGGIGGPPPVPTYTPVPAPTYTAEPPYPTQPTPPPVPTATGTTIVGYQTPTTNLTSLQDTVVGSRITTPVMGGRHVVMISANLSVTGTLGVTSTVSFAIYADSGSPMVKPGSQLWTSASIAVTGTGVVTAAVPITLPLTSMTSYWWVMNGNDGRLNAMYDTSSSSGISVVTPYNYTSAGGPFPPSGVAIGNTQLYEGLSCSPSPCSLPRQYTIYMAVQ